MAVVALSTGVAGAQTPYTYKVTANGGFISLSLLSNAVQLTGGGSAADAGSGPYADASGTGLCASLSSAPSGLCPTDATTALPSGTLLDSTARANVTATTPTASPGTESPAPACILPLNLGILDADIGCGTASASVTGGTPTANGDGNLGTVTVNLGDLGIPSLANGASIGSLCPSASPSSSSSTAPAPTSLVTSLLAPVNSLLSSVGANVLPTSVLNGATSPLSGLCGIISGLTSVAGSLPLLGSVLDNANASTPLLSITLGDSDSNISTATSGDPVVTSGATTKAIDINLLGMLDIQVLPNSADIAVDPTTGVVSFPSQPTVGILQVTPIGSAPTDLTLPALNAALAPVLNALDSALNGIASPNLIEVAPADTTLTGTPATGETGSAEAADLKLSLLNGLLVLNVGDASVTASSVPAAETSAAVVQPTTAAATVAATPVAATPVPAVPTAAVVPNVTTVHTGEFWSGTLAPFVGGGMALAGLMLITRRRLFSVARSVVIRHRR
jgi:hypothetical protein